MLRESNQRFMVQILEYEDEYLARIQALQNPNVLAWYFDADDRPFRDSDRVDELYNQIWESPARRYHKPESAGPRICIGTDHLIVLVPSEAAVGDVVIQFWGSSASIVMRPFITSTYRESYEYNEDTQCRQWYLKIIGIADMANSESWKTRGARHIFRRVRNHLDLDYECRTEGPVYVDLDFPTLQIISS